MITTRSESLRPLQPHPLSPSPTGRGGTMVERRSLTRAPGPIARLALGALLTFVYLPASAQVTGIRAGRLIDPETGAVSTNQVILVQDRKFTAVGGNVTIPQDATVIDLSQLTVLPGLVDSHNHLSLTYKEMPENNVYYLTYILDSSPLRAI